MQKLWVVLSLFLATAAHALTITKAGPIGELSKITEANEIRVVFSEPMVVVGKIPKNLTVPWFHVSPAIKGNFRWSGTTTLIFTPDPKSPLPYATKYDVAIDADAKAVSGKTLEKPYSFSFTTPTIQLLSTGWYRKEGRFDGPIVIGLRFNQPVDAQTIIQHLQLRTKAHELEKIEPPKDRNLEFEDKLAKAKAAAASDGAPVLSFVATEWDQVRFKPGDDLVVIQTKPGVPPGTNLQVYLDGELAKDAKHVRSGRKQEYTIELDPMFFVKSVGCRTECNPDWSVRINFTVDVPFDSAAKSVHVRDVTDPAHPVPLQPSAKEGEREQESSRGYSLDDLGYSTLPAHTYEIRFDPTLTADDDEPLGYAWSDDIEFWHQVAFVSFGDGHGVWESSGGPLLPFHARNYQNVKQWLAPLTVDQLMPAIVKLEKEGFHSTPDVQPVMRKLAPVADKTQSYGLDISPATGPGVHGLVWAAVQEGDPIPKAKRESDPEPSAIRATIVQATNLGVSIKDSPQNTLVLVTRLDDASPVAGAKVSIRNTENKVVWSAVTGNDGIAVAPSGNLRAGKQENDDDEEYFYPDLNEIRFIAIAEKDGDVAFAASNWNDGIQPWEFGTSYNPSEAKALARGTVFADRGVYKLGEEVHLKAVIRNDTPMGMQLLPAGTKVTASVNDSHGKQVDSRELALNDWSSVEWIVKVPDDSPLGMYSVRVQIDEKRSVIGEFLVAAYRRPEFRTDVTLTGPTSVAGTPLEGHISGRYLFGAPMSSARVKWTYSRTPLYDVPSKIADRFPEEHWRFLGREVYDLTATQISTKTTKLTAQGELKLSLETATDLAWPWEYELEADVTDVSRQHIAGRDSFRVDPAPWYIGLGNMPFFADTNKGLDTQVVAAGLDGIAVAGVNVKVELHRIQWNSVRQSQGNGFYTWETEKKDIPSGEWSVATQSGPAPLHVPVSEGGFYMLVATASDGAGHSTTTRSWFYSVGGGYTAWERFDNNRIDLVPEKKHYRPGETARIMVKSPWEHATALLTTEREGVRTWKEFPLTSTQQTISVPLTEKDIPNVFVSVLLLKGRTKDGIEDESDPGKPAFRLGYIELKVDDATKRLKVEVKTDRQEFRPATKAKIDVTVRDASGKPSQSEVTLWAVDYGVLSLTGYKTPDVLSSIYLDKSLQVVTDDSRQKIVSRRVLTPKGETQGGGGGADSGPGMLRRDFRVLAFWVGSIVTDRNGRAHIEVTLPESLTTYRIMAVAGDKASRFGWAQNEIRISKPVLITPTFPRFLALGDKARFGGVIHSQLKEGGTATMTIKSADPSILEIKNIDSDGKVQVPAGGAVEVRADAVAKAVGVARVQLTVSLNGESDGLEDIVPVRILASPETVAAYGEASPQAKETLAVPDGVIPSVGGLHVELASTAMVGLGEGARYLVDYPYGCAEQRSSAAMALMLAGDLGDAFSLPGIDAKHARGIAQKTLNELPKFQCGDGGYVYWAGDCFASSPYLTANILHVQQRAVSLKYDVSKESMDRAYKFLDEHLKEKRPENEGWWPAYTAWQAFAVKVLVEGGHEEDSAINRLFSYTDRMPVFGMSYLADALIAKGDKGDRLTDLHRRINNAILPEGGTAHVEELNDPYLLWFWNSNVRSTAIALRTLVRRGEDEQLSKQIVRWLMQVRKGGRWGNTQENVWAMESLVDYYRKYESVTPDFTGVVTMGGEPLARDAFRGRSTEAKAHDVPMQQLLAKPGTHEVLFDRQGVGTLFYLMRLRYAQSIVIHDPLDQGFKVERIYPSKTFKAGDTITIKLRIRNTKERRFVAVTDPIPAGTEPVESWFSTTASDLAEQQRKLESSDDWMTFVKRGGWDHVERHDDRVELFATRLGEGLHEFSYVVRATTSGTFMAAPTHVEEMYEPEVFGRTGTDVVEVK